MYKALHLSYQYNELYGLSRLQWIGTCSADELIYHQSILVANKLESCCDSPIVFAVLSKFQDQEIFTADLITVKTGSLWDRII